MKRLWFKFVLILLLFSVSLLVALPNQNKDDSTLPKKVFGFTLPSWFPKSDINLGLDLQGGSQLVYDIDLSKVPPNKKANIINGVKQVIEKRVNALGVTEAVVQTQTAGGKTHIIVELPGIKDLDEAKAKVGKVVQLKFKEESDTATQEELTEIAQENKFRKQVAEKIINYAEENKVSLKDAYDNVHVNGFDTEEEKSKIAKYKEGDELCGN